MELEKAKKTRKNVDRFQTGLAYVAGLAGLSLVVWFFVWVFSASVPAGAVILVIVLFFGTGLASAAIDEKAEKVIERAKMEGTVDD